MTVHELKLKYAALVNVAEHAVMIMCDPTPDPNTYRVNVHNAAKQLQHTLEDVKRLDEGDAMAAPGIKNGATS